MILRLIVFFILNFGALAIGSVFTGSGVPSEWYQSLNKAPWTPPGWVFGAAWTTIMICFSFYMALLWKNEELRKFILISFSIQFVLNVIWNPVFFQFQNVLFGLIVITALTILIAVMFIKFFPFLKAASILILPYLLWLIIATSLNAFILFKN
ncbi:MAG: TspO/MBR family protein [Deltaproteobacteria bacterium]